MFQDEGIQINDGWLDSLNTIENPDLAEFYAPRQRAENEDGEIENKQHVTADCDPGITEETSPITDQKTMDGVKWRNADLE